MLKLTFLGGAREVGRAAVHLKDERRGLVLDYGVLLNEQPHFPAYVSPREYDAIVLTHPHLDHSGDAPSLYTTSKKPILGTTLTFEIFRVLIRDELKISRGNLNFGRKEVKKLLRNIVTVNYGAENKVGRWSFYLFSSGHIPGSSYVLVNVGGKRVMYTSDINTINTRLVRGAVIRDVKPDALIIESTYADTDHPPRKELEKEFVVKVLETLADGGVALIPAFSVSRAQEILMILEHFGVTRKYPVYVDGMARIITRIFQDYIDYIAEQGLFLDALKHSKFINDPRMRLKALKEPSVVISPAGMLQGGPVYEYLPYLLDKEESSVFFVGYQIEGTPGRRLLEQKIIELGDKTIRPSLRIEKFDFSSHAGKTQLLEIIEKVKKEDMYVFVVHGEEKKAIGFAEEVSSTFGVNALAPVNGDTFTV